MRLSEVLYVADHVIIFFPEFDLMFTCSYAPRRGGILRQVLRYISPSRRRLATTALPISELDFRRALDEYSEAEFRLGK
jgi:hypothetical protein